MNMINRLIAIDAKWRRTRNARERGRRQLAQLQLSREGGAECYVHLLLYVTSSVSYYIIILIIM